MNKNDHWLLKDDSPACQPVGEPIGWYTDDHLTDRSATTYDRTVAKRWRAKGWPVYPLYAAPPAQAVTLMPRPMTTAPRDGTMVRLLVQFKENATEDTADPAWTIGACNDDNVGEDERVGWKFAGWCWTHDHFTEGKGTPVGWLPMVESAQAVDAAEKMLSVLIEEGVLARNGRVFQKLRALIDSKAVGLNDEKR